MAEIIEFPGNDAFLRRHFEKIINESLRESNPVVKDCIKKRVSETLSKHPGIPTLKISLPLALSETDVRILTEVLTSEYNAQVSAFAKELVAEICNLQAKLCRCEHKK